MKEMEEAKEVEEVKKTEGVKKTEEVKEMDEGKKVEGAKKTEEAKKMKESLETEDGMEAKGKGEVREKQTDVSDMDVDEVIALLDGYTQAGESRIKINVIEGQGEVVSRQYHHGRCDVGSPWACGTAFDVLE